MVLIHVHYSLKPGKRDEFVDKVKEAGILSATVTEPGNLMYRYTFPEDDENEIILLEAWEDKIAIEEHLKTQHAEELKRIKQFYVEETLFKTYKVTEKLG